MNYMVVDTFFYWHTVIQHLFFIILVTARIINCGIREVWVFSSRKIMWTCLQNCDFPAVSLQYSTISSYFIPKKDQIAPSIETLVEYWTHSFRVPFRGSYWVYIYINYLKWDLTGQDHGNWKSWVLHLSSHLVECLVIFAIEPSCIDGDWLFNWDLKWFNHRIEGYDSYDRQNRISRHSWWMVVVAFFLPDPGIVTQNRDTYQAPTWDMTIWLPSGNLT